MTDFQYFVQSSGVDVSFISLGEVLRFGKNKQSYIIHYQEGYAWGNWKEGFSGFEPKKKVKPKTFPKLTTRIPQQPKNNVDFQQRYLDFQKRAIEPFSENKYIKRKQLTLTAPHSLLVTEDKPSVIQLFLRGFEPANNIAGIQLIYEDGKKRFAKGTSFQKGTHFLIEAGESEYIYVVEGWATGQTLKQCGLKGTIICAMSAINIEKVVFYAKKVYNGNRKIVIASDNDHRNNLNIGLLKAQKVATETNSYLVYPPFKPNEEGSDWNDFYISYGAEAVKMSVEQQLAKTEHNCLVPVQRYCDYLFSDNAVFVRKDAGEDYFYLCSHFEVLALLLDEDEGDVYILIKVMGWGSFKTIVKKPSFFQVDPLIISSFLSDSGIIVNTDLKSKALIQVFSVLVQQQIWDLEKRGTEMYKIKDSCGWGRATVIRGGLTESITSFYLPRRENFNLYNLDEKEGVYVQNTNTIIPSQAGTYPVDTIRKMEKYPYLVLTLIVSLASSLIRYMGLSPQNCIIHLFGMAGCGKTTALKIAGSVWGNIKEDHNFIGMWSSTLASIEHIAHRHSELFLGLDELKGLASHRRQADVITLLAEGRSKDRAVKAKKSNYETAKRLKWNLCFLSVGEHSLEQVINEPLSDGMRRRFLEFELPDREAGGILWNPDAEDEVDRFEDKNTIAELEQEMHENHGRIGEMWVSFLNKSATKMNVTDGKVGRRRAELCKELMKSLPPELNSEYADILSMLYSVAISMQRAKILSDDLDLKRLFVIYGENLNRNSAINRSQNQTEQDIVDNVIGRLWGARDRFLCTEGEDHPFNIKANYGFYTKLQNKYIFYVFIDVYQREFCGCKTFEKPTLINRILTKHNILQFNHRDKYSQQIEYKGTKINGLYRLDVLC